MTTAVRKEAPHHNNLTCIKDYNCRLPECQERHRAYRRACYQSKVAGTWQPLVDAEPVRQHLMELYAAGFSTRRVAALAGVPFETVSGFTRALTHSTRRRARKRRCTREVKAKLLAISVDRGLPGKVNALGTQRRIQALVAAGWPMSHLGLRFGLTDRSAAGILRQSQIYGRTATTVIKVYDDLASKRPERNGVSRKSAKRARLLASKRRWATVTYWADRLDVIDDPHFTPEYKIPQAQLLADEARWLITTAGLTRDEAAEHLRKNRTYIDQVLAEPEVTA
ncbi:hypothetical protein AB0D56_09780 [Streptomyces sp. NPDC048209]|uniref:hypothetical protein n=1 Tax=Streptomyces sp. NPDC048209 TaxID=3156689 RepID=UPI0034168D60